MKRTILMIMAVVFAFCLTACGCEHEWNEATCTAPKTCKLCEATEGEVKAHQWQDATCTEPKTCKDCGATEGDVGGHVWEDATCTTAKTCSVCKETEGEALGHQWVDATCTEAKTCSVCSEKEGEPLGHTASSWTVEKEATCSEVGSESSVCDVCGETATREIPTLEHTPGEWQVKVKATLTSNGTEAQKCAVCDKELETRSYELAPFDIKPLKTKSTFKYDEFTKSWKYYKTYDNRYSDATESITIIVFSEDNGTNIEDIELRAGLYWKDAAKENWDIDTVQFIVGEKIYSCKMTAKSDSPMAYTFLASDTSYQMIKDMAEASSIKAKISYVSGFSTEMKVGSSLKSICQDIVKYNMWDYYSNGYLISRDTTRVN